MSGRYPTFPEHIKERLNDNFLKEFKMALDQEFINDEKPKNPTYWNYYQWKDNTGGFYVAFENACNKLNENSLLNFMESLHYPDSDILYSKVTSLLYENNIIEQGDPSENWRMYVGIDKYQQLLKFLKYYSKRMRREK